MAIRCHEDSGNKIVSRRIPGVMLEVYLPVQEPTEYKSGVFCPICVANGYASAPANQKEWFFTANSVGSAIWSTAIPRLQLGLTFHGSSRGIRALAAYRAIQETERLPGLNISYGLESQETGATGTALTLEKNWNNWNVFGGVSLQTDDRRVRPVGGFKYTPDQTWYFGNQYDGRANNPFVQYVWKDYSVGVLLVSGRNATLTFGVSF